MNEQTYTQQEIDTKINTLETEVDLLKSQRTDLSKNINNKKKQIQSWKEFDISQFKMF
jgi:chaperonin cofactor prefoldin